jgi:hypothetical protein
MEMILDPVLTVPVRIRFAGTADAETFHRTPTECARFHSDWKSYLGGNGAIGGEYSSEEADHPLVISLNFSLIAYIEPGKVY